MGDTQRAIPTRRSHFGLFAILLAVLLAILFFRSFQPDEVVFSNDGPLGGLMAAVNRMPDVLFGAWHDINWIGSQSPTPAINITSTLRLVTSPLLFAKIFPAASLFILGLGAWFCFRQMKLSPLACLLGGLAAALSSHFLSTACWGVASQTIAFGLSFIALGLLFDDRSPHRWVKTILAGLAVGMNIMEAFDIGAIFSLYIAAYVCFQMLSRDEQSPAAARIGRVALRVALIAAFAAFLSTEALVSLIGTQIKGIAGTEQTPEAKAARWDFATQWSLPKSELPRVVIPGLFGYRMDTPRNMEMLSSWFEGGAYWGKVGETPGWSENHNDPAWSAAHGGGTPRFSGGGEYAGVLVVVVALWAVLQSFRKKDSVYTLAQRKFIWFWAAAAFISVLLAFGRYAPFYQFVYMVPYFSTIRNPAKFTHPFNWSLVILFAYGIHGLSRRYLAASSTSPPSPRGEGWGEGNAASSAPRSMGRAKEKSSPQSRNQGDPSGIFAQLKSWWPKATAFEKKWTYGSVIAVGLSMFAFLIYASSKPALEKHLAEVGFADSTLATQMAGFSIREFGLFIVCLALTVGLLILVMSGRFSGPRSRWGAILLGVLMVADLSRANLPWIIYWDYKDKYATNPVIDFLRDKPYEHRVSTLPFRAPQQFALLGEVYRIEWAQHHFQYYNIQSLDIVQMPRMPVDYVAFETALSFDGTSNTLHHITRRWELTNTRYLLGAAGFLDVLNQQIDPVQHRFRIAERFDLVPKPGQTDLKTYEQFTAVENTNGQYAVFSFNGALPRAKLYSDWQVNTNDQATLKQLSDDGFDPEKKLLVSSDIQPSLQLSATNSGPGNVDFVSYAPKRVVLEAKANAASILLLNDRYDPNWKVTVDGKPEPILRCNYLMRGVRLSPGDHRIEFRFEPPITGLYVSLAAIVLGLGLIGFLAFTKADEPVPPAPAMTPSPAKAREAAKV